MNSAARDKVCAMLGSHRRWAQQHALRPKDLAGEAERGILALQKPQGVACAVGISSHGCAEAGREGFSCSFHPWGRVAFPTQAGVGRAAAFSLS